MNERIRELAKEAGFHFYDMHDVDGQDLGETIESDSWAAAEKLVELVVLECVRHFNEDYQRDWSTQWREDLSTSIKKHFGVEE